MTTPGGGAPGGAYVLGSGFGSDMTEESARAIMKGGPVGSYQNAEAQFEERIGNVQEEAVSLAEAAANDAAQAAADAEAATSTAQDAYDLISNFEALASYWETECVVASADVGFGVNELIIGLCQNVPDGRTRLITDLHLAFSEKPGTMTIETKKWNAAGTSSSVVHTATLGANVTRINYSTLGIAVADKERIYWNITATSAYATVFQALVFGVII